ncbi:MAG: LptA/OstA family protein [Thermodesulfovibrionales bacterium]|nr:LptA/OstA family protein [Thermodesulfovibrionales bacterium]
MLRQLFIVSVFISVVLAGSIFAEEKTEQIKGPIVITSQTLLSDNKARTALFEGSVVAKTENMTLYSDKMLVYYAEGSGNVTKIEAEGRVKLVKKDLIVTSKVANYFADEEKIIFTGEPKAVQKGDIITGTKMTYWMNEDRSFVENSRVLLENKKGK